MIKRTRFAKEHEALSSVIENFLTRQSRFGAVFSKSTQRGYGSDLQSIASQLNATGKNLLSAEREEIVAVLPSRATTEARRRAVSAVRAFFRYCKRQGRQGTATIPSVSTRPYNSLYTPQQHIDDVLARIPNDGLVSLRDRAILCLTYGMGMKPGELLGLTGEQLKPIDGRKISLSGVWLYYEYVPTVTSANPDPIRRLIPVQPPYAKGYEDFKTQVEPGQSMFCSSRRDHAPLKGTKGLQRIIDQYVQIDNDGKPTPDNSKTLRNGYIVLLKEANAGYQVISEATGIDKGSASRAINYRTFSSTARTT